MTAFVYILQSQRNGRYYIGFSTDPQKRLAEHNNGRVRSTKNLRPWMMVYTEEHPDETSARQREYYIKSMKSRVYIQSLIGLNAVD
ncbi:MAG: GIY-YIG nuclease family protein [Dehalococcoidia bacterium]